MNDEDLLREQSLIMIQSSIRQSLDELDGIAKELEVRGDEGFIYFHLL